MIKDMTLTNKHQMHEMKIENLFKVETPSDVSPHKQMIHLIAEVSRTSHIKPDVNSFRQKNVQQLKNENSLDRNLDYVPHKFVKDGNHIVVRVSERLPLRNTNIQFVCRLETTRTNSSTLSCSDTI